MDYFSKRINGELVTSVDFLGDEQNLRRSLQVACENNGIAYDIEQDHFGGKLILRASGVDVRALIIEGYNMSHPATRPTQEMRSL